MTSLPEKLIAIIAPHHCLVCSQENNVLCEQCILQLPLAESCCFLCSAETREFAVCRPCRTSTMLEHVWTASEYTGVVMEAIKQFKFGRARAVVYPLAALMALQLPRLENYIIIPIPTAPARVRQRGYDHARLLAVELGKILSLRTNNLLGRNTASRQVGASRAGRLAQAQQAFYVTHPMQCTGARILLVDDVVTTGASLQAAAQLLYAAGAKSVNAVVVARQK